MASSSGTSSGSFGSEDQSLLVIDQRKQKRMLSNRESARRSRMRKQKHLDGLTAQVAQLRKENNQILTSLNITTQHYLNIESENSILRAQMEELSHRLQSLNEIIHYLNANNMSFESTTTDHHHHYHLQDFQTTPADNFMNPWNSVYLNQPIMASADMFQY
ncbi:Basic-leucine zipper domain [Macleaya cordata]|uniref:Basic-leucine zipper domain n=1 Tax=Macleaya cordata TaxID=56857 RepID=A0A200Q759_MACCD|nr:Basic-leucine zipper domain [Macleaya cordata]